MQNKKHIDSAETAVNAYIENLTALGRSPATIRTHRYGLERFLKDHPGISVLEITQEMVHAHINRLRDQGFTAKTMQVHIYALRGFLTHLYDNGVIFDNPARDLCWTGPERRQPKVVSYEDMMGFIESVDTSTPVGIRNRAIIEVLYSTAMRRGELLGLKTGDVDLEQHTVLVLGKGSKERLLPLGRHANLWLDRYMTDVRPELLDGGESDALWISSRHHRPLGEGAIAHFLRGLSPDLSPHTIRRSSVTHMLRNGAHPALLAEMLGHADLGTLSRYLNVTVADIKSTHLTTRVGQ